MADKKQKFMHIIRCVREFLTADVCAISPYLVNKTRVYSGSSLKKKGKRSRGH